MQRFVHLLSTLWIYAHRSEFLEQLRAEYIALGKAKRAASDLATQLHLERRRGVVAEEIRALAQPLRPRMLWANLPDMTRRAEVHASAQQMIPQREEFINAA